MRSRVEGNVQVEAIVAEVLRRLTSESATPATRLQLSEAVVSLEQIEQIPNAIQEIVVSPTSVVTPSARDAIRQRGLRVEGAALHSSTEPVARRTPASRKKQPIRLTVDSTDATVESGIRAQVQRRGVKLCPKSKHGVVVSDKPATAAWNAQKSGWFPVVVNRLSDIGRFAGQAPIDCWVCDSSMMNFMATVNAIVTVANLPAFVGETLKEAT